MSLAVIEEHLALRDAVARFLAARCTRDVVRAAVDADAGGRPPFWDELAALGWLGLHLPEDVGGDGHGLAEAAVVLEALGRAMAPGPFLPTMVASAAMAAGGGDPGLLGALATGRAVGTLAFGAPLDAHSTGDGSLVVDGRLPCHHAPSVRTPHRPVPGCEAPLRRHARRSRAGRPACSPLRWLRCR